jgi:hypothetical protein
MKAKYLGDSYDLVKRFWAEKLAGIAPIYAHPRFIPEDLRAAFRSVTTIPILPTEIGKGRFGLFLDPCTGIPLPNARGQRVTQSHAPLSFISDEIKTLCPAFLICFDQSHHRRKGGPSMMEQRQQKLNSLAKSGISSFYYVSHATFLFASKESKVLEGIRCHLVKCGIPSCRFTELCVPAARDDKMARTGVGAPR